MIGYPRVQGWRRSGGETRAEVDPRARILKFVTSEEGLALGRPLDANSDEGPPDRAPIASKSQASNLGTIQASNLGTIKASNLGTIQASNLGTKLPIWAHSITSGRRGR